MGGEVNVTYQNILKPPFYCRETVAKGRVTLIFFQMLKYFQKYSKILESFPYCLINKPQKLPKMAKYAYVTYLIRNLGVIIQHPDQCYST